MMSDEKKRELVFENIAITFGDKGFNGGSKLKTRLQGGWSHVFPFQVNSAFLRPGVDPNTINSLYRRQTQSLCKCLGYTAQETAVIIAAQIPVHYNYKVNKINFIDFVNKRIVRGDVKEIQDAKNKLFDEFKSY